jgi:hypothetical protein
MAGPMIKPAHLGLERPRLGKHEELQKDHAWISGICCFKNSGALLCLNRPQLECTTTSKKIMPGCWHLLLQVFAGTLTIGKHNQQEKKSHPHSRYLLLEVFTLCGGGQRKERIEHVRSGATIGKHHHTQKRHAHV